MDLLAGADETYLFYSTFLFAENLDGFLTNKVFLEKNAGELWHFTQPFLRGNAVGNLWAVSYTARKTLVVDGGFLASGVNQ